MAGAAEDPGRRRSDRETDAIRQRLGDLEGRLKDVRARNRPFVQTPQDRGSAMGQALRLSTELIAGVLVGGLIGWTLDHFFGTAPLMLVTFLVLGAAAGILNVMRSAKAMQPTGPLPGKDLPADDDDE